MASRGETRTHLEEEALDEGRIHLLVLVEIVEVALQVHGEVLEDEVEPVLLHDDVLEADDVRMAQLLKATPRFKPGQWG